MKNILVVDDERPFLLSLKDGLLSSGDQFKVVLANDGKQALQILETQPIDLLVTDLKMPVMDGFQLLANVSRQYPQLPIIVMTAFGTPEIESKLAGMNALHYLEKPLDLDLLAQTIMEALSTEGHSFIRGISLATFLQLVHLEKKSCSLKVRSQGQTGYLFIRQGELIDAQTGELQGEAAALVIVAWDDAEIEMDNTCRRSQKKIDPTIEFILMEAFRIKDEANQQEGVREPLAPRPDPEPPARPDDKLLEILRGNQAIKEFAIFDDANFLEHQNDETCSLAKLDPAFFLAVSHALGEQLDAGQFRYLLFTTSRRIRHLMFQQNQRRVILTLEEGSKPAEIIAQLEPALF
jgi:CheY-like chemotaxis protein